MLFDLSVRSTTNIIIAIFFLVVFYFIYSMRSSQSRSITKSESRLDSINQRVDDSATRVDSMEERLEKLENPVVAEEEKPRIQ